MSVSAHDAAVAGMFGRIAGMYDAGNRILSCGIDIYWRRVLADTVRLGPTRRVLDLAAGTLDVALAVRRRWPEATVPALDFCPPMLRRGLPKLARRAERLIFPVAADAKRLPLPDASVDCVTMAFGIRNITPRSEAFSEMLRVLVPGGRACILEFGSGRERIWGGLYNWYLRLNGTSLLCGLLDCFWKIACVFSEPLSFRKVFMTGIRWITSMPRSRKITPRDKVAMSAGDNSVRGAGLPQLSSGRHAEDGGRFPVRFVSQSERR